MLFLICSCWISEQHRPATAVRALSLCLSRVISDQNIHRQPIQSQSDGSSGEESSYAAMLLMIILSLALCHSLLLLAAGAPLTQQIHEFWWLRSFTAELPQTFNLMSQLVSQIVFISSTSDTASHQMVPYRMHVWNLIKVDHQMPSLVSFMQILTTFARLRYGNDQYCSM